MVRRLKELADMHCPDSVQAAVDEFNVCARVSGLSNRSVPFLQVAMQYPNNIPQQTFSYGIWHL